MRARNGNAYFSTDGYLAANPDVRANGMNPLTHFDEYGWKEGRDSSANFDAQLYLVHNPDVAAAEMDPLEHYLSYGQYRGEDDLPGHWLGGPDRQPTKGSTRNTTSYLTPTWRGLPWARRTGWPSRYGHYETYGWHEGRNPNAWFDVKGYLDAYPDVKAAGMDPLFHYDTLGLERRPRSVCLL